jgi:hypothetical protein
MTPIRIFTPVVSPNTAPPRCASSVELASGELTHDVVEGKSDIEAFGSFLSGQVDEKLIHVLSPNCIVLPSFYEAADTIMQHSKCDYVFCHFMSNCNQKEAKLLQFPISAGSFNVSQFIVRQWVFKEIGIGRSLDEMYERIIREYRGAEVKAILCVEI